MADTYQTIDCPACGKKMKKIFVKEVGFNVDICADGCGGIFFDNKELKSFDEQHEILDKTILEVESKEFPPVDDDADRFCPACGAKMVKLGTKAQGSIRVDECYTCGGKFLDHGELTRMRAEFATEKQRREDAVKYLYSQIGEELAGDRSLTRKNIPLHKKFVNLLSQIIGM